MRPSPEHWLDKTHAGDCLGLLQRMRDDGVQVQTCITSPPYFRLRSYLPSNHPDKPLEIGACATPEQYIDRLVQVFRVVREILTDDGTLWIVIGDSYAGSRSARSGSVYIGGKHGKAQAAVNRITPVGDIKPKDLLGIPWLLAFALRRDGWTLRQDIIWHKPNAMPESMTDRCTRSHEYLFLLSKYPRYYFDQTAMQEPAAYPRGPGNLHPARQPPHEHLRLRSNLHNIGTRAVRNKRDVWTVATGGFKGSHFAVFPARLIAPCVLAASRVGDTVLDPFMGSGTTAAVALQHQRHFIGCELVHEFIAQQRLHV
ncbi:DNA adenine methylase [Ventosimonas gracilis]|uniref:Methyltransferase n=1 Tax=Ventosimonas gracilis TaxID=1680762 RepID=A0A139SUS1_9GAMM|nr:site-specific DNA-methyltransferase [Ventosimonas gracilis]KXU38358.1 DNA adenine methylase [Ventosimonas gracilis]